MARTYDSQTSVRIPPAVLLAIDQIAENNNATRSKIIVALLRQALKIPEPPKTFDLKVQK